MAFEINLEKKLEKNISHKMIDEFGKVSLTPLFKVVMNKYIRGDFSLSAEDISSRYNKKAENKLRKNIYASKEMTDKFDRLVEDRTGVSLSRKRTAALEMCLIKWLDHKYEITKKEFEKYYVR